MDPLTYKCDEWDGTLDKDGYGLTYLDGKQMGAHRAIWILEVGPVPEGLMVLHRCHNRKCCEITHLYVGDHAQNMRDRAASGRNRSGRDRLTPELVAKIRELCAKKPQRWVASALRLPKSVIGDVMSGRCWSDR